MIKIFSQIFYNEDRKHCGDLDIDGKMILIVAKHSGYKSWSFREDRIKLTFLGQAAALGCEGFATFQELTPSPSSGCAGGLVAPKWWLGVQL